MTTTTKFGAKDETQLEGALAEPPGSGKAGAVVVVQEWHGLNEYVRSTCDAFAREGFVALAPDLFHGKVAKSDDQASQMMASLDRKRAVAEIGEAVRFSKGHPRSNGRVAIVGFCMGGALAFEAARSIGGLAAVVPFYGLPAGVPLDELARIAVPIQAHFAKRDDWAKASIAEEIEKKVRAAGGHMELHVYDAGHAFMRSTDPRVYDAASAKLAWERTVAFLKKHLG